MKIRLVPTQRHFFDQYVGWCETRKREPMPYFQRASAYLWVESDEYGLVLGVGLYDSPVFVLAEEMVSNPSAPAWLVHLAVRMAAKSWLMYCAANCKFPVMHTSSRGLIRLLGKMGFQQLNCVTLTRLPFHEVAVVKKAPRPKPEPKRKPRARKGPRVKA